ncbi:MAG: hypothetical protein J6S58_03215 [Lentisphaeria bacterium]|nr:hypothetical protein [Lentisphaeria bacterium]
MEKKHFPCRGWMILLLSCLLLSVSFPAAGRTTVQQKADVSYRDSLTGILFPARIGGFRKSVVRVYPHKILGTRITYSSPVVATCGADLYIYALEEVPLQEISPEALDLHSRTVQKTFEKNLKDRPGISHVKVLPGGGYRFRMDGKEFYSGLRIIPYGKFVIRVHLTQPAAGYEKNSELFFKALQKLLTINDKVSDNGK